MSNTELVIQALQSGDIELLKRVPKTDLHNHSTNGCSREYIKKHTGVNIPKLTEKLKSMDEMEQLRAPFLEQDCFYSIDLYCDEFAQPIKNFKPLYRKAKEKGWLLKAHVGEWGTADDVKEAAEELNKIRLYGLESRGNYE